MAELMMLLPLRAWTKSIFFFRQLLMPFQMRESLGDTGLP
jgi:hypothetical protein